MGRVLVALETSYGVTRHRSAIDLGDAHMTTSRTPGVNGEAVEPRDLPGNRLVWLDSACSIFIYQGALHSSVRYSLERGGVQPSSYHYHGANDLGGIWSSLRDRVVNERLMMVRVIHRVRGSLVGKMGSCVIEDGVLCMGLMGPHTMLCMMDRAEQHGGGVGLTLEVHLRLQVGIELASGPTVQDHGAPLVIGLASSLFGLGRAPTPKCAIEFW